MQREKRRGLVMLDRLVRDGETLYRYRLVGLSPSEIAGSTLYPSAEACLTEADQALELLNFVHAQRTPEYLAQAS